MINAAPVTDKTEQALSCASGELNMGKWGGTSYQRDNNAAPGGGSSRYIETQSRWDAGFRHAAPGKI